VFFVSDAHLTKTLIALKLLTTNNFCYLVAFVHVPGFEFRVLLLLHNRDVNVMFGWAVFHARRTKMIERYRGNDDFHKYEELTGAINFLSAMRMYKSEAALSGHYLEKCYHDSIRTSDRGRMTLIKEEYFDFGFMLMDSLSSAVTDNVLRLEKEAILNRKPLWEYFREASKKVEYATEDNKRKMFELLVKKTIHAV
jgi:hypothetical protein